MTQLRKVLIALMGHVDHGKTSLLDRIRGSAVAKAEAGGITQAVGASIVPIDTVKKICGPLLNKLKLQVTIPGLLFIDTPGHAAFTNLRKRGGALADIAILVIDIKEGFKPQTLESIEILKSDKTPFVVAANKLDLVPGWGSHPDVPLLQSISQQAEHVRQEFDMKIYELIGKLYELGFQAERFDRVSDYTQQLAIIPLSAITGEGIPELVMVLTGLAQKYLEKKLQAEVSGAAKGTVLEVHEEEGLGTTADVIVYDGVLKVGDTIAIGGIEKPVVTKVRALLEPLPLVEMRVRKAKFTSVSEISAATGVKISAPELLGVAAGMPLRSCTQSNVDEAVREVQKDVHSIVIETEQTGIVVKADTLGSLEAMIVLLKEHGVPIRFASIGKIGKREVMEAEAMGESNPFFGVVLGFNVNVVDEANELVQSKNVKVILSDVIYRIIDGYEHWKVEKKKAIEIAELERLVRGGRFRILENHTFRQSNPAVVGVEVLAGRIKAGEPIMNAEGRKLTAVKSIQEEKETVNVAEAGARVAVAMDDVIVGRQIHEGDMLYIDVPEEHFRKMKELKYYLTKGDTELLKEIAEIKRKQNIAWGV